MEGVTAACAAQAAVVAGLLGYAAARDLRYREVDPLYWALAAFLAAPLAPFCWSRVPGGMLAPTVASNAATVGLVAILARLCLVGGADVAALALLAAAYPALPDGFPSAVAAALYASAAEAAAAPVFCVYNLIARRRLALRAGSLLPYCLLGIAVTVAEGRSRPWWYPLRAPGGASGDRWACVAEDPHEAWARLASARGEEAPTWATPGFPFLPFMLAGFLASLALPPTRIAEALLAS